MEHMKGYNLKCFFPALAWGVLCIFFLLALFFTCSEYGEYRSLCNVGLVDDGIDELHTTLLSVSVGALVCLSVIACVGLVWTLRKSKVRPLKAEPVDGESVHPGLDAALQLLHIDKFRGCVIYTHKSFDASPRVLLFLEKLVQKEDHTLSLEELGELLGKGYSDGTESCRSRLRNIKCIVHKTLRDTPFDVVRDAFGNFKLVLKEGGK